MQSPLGYDNRYRGRTYDRALRRGAGYDRDFGQPTGHRARRGTDYDRDLEPFGGRYFAPLPGERGYPSARWGWNPISWAMWPGRGAAGYDVEEFYERPRRRPEESPTYGRGGDRAIRRWSRRYGYDFEGTIRPRNPSHRQEFP